MKPARALVALCALLAASCALFDHPDPCEVLGTVQDYPAGTPLSGAKIKLLQGNRVVIADAQGRFRFPDLPASASFEFSAAGHVMSRRQFTFQPGETRAIDIPLPAEGQTITPSLVLFERGGRIWSVDSLGSDERCLTEDMEGTQVSPTWLWGKGQFAFIQRQPGRTRVWTRYPSGAPARFIAEVPDSAAELRWHPLGEQFAFVVSLFTPSHGMVTKIRRLDINTGLQTDLLTGTLEANPAWSLDGLQLAWSRRVGQRPWQIWVAANRGERQHMLPARGSCVEPAFSPNGAQIIYCSNARGPWDLYLAGLNSGLSDPLTHCPEGGFCRRPLWSNDGSEILFESNYHPGMAKIQASTGLYALRPATGQTRTLVIDARGASW